MDYTGITRNPSRINLGITIGLIRAKGFLAVIIL